MKINRAHLWAAGRVVLAVALLGIIFKFIIPLHDTVHLKDGRVLSGTFWREETSAIRIEVDDDQAAELMALSMSTDAAASQADRSLVSRTAAENVFFVTADQIALDNKGNPRIARGFISLVKEMTLGRYLAGLALLAAIPWLAALRWQALVKAQDIPIGYGKAIELTYLGLFCNNFMPGLTGGDFAKAYYVSKLTSTKKASAVVTVFLDRLIGLVMMAWLAGAAVCLTLLAPVGPSSGAFTKASYIVAACMVLSLVGGVCFFSKRIRALGARITGWMLKVVPGLAAITSFKLVVAYISIVKRMDEAVFLYRHRKRTLVFAAVISLLAHSTAITAIYLFARALNVTTVDIVSCFVVVPVAFMVSSIPVAPAGWGIGEMAFKTFFAAVGVAATAAVTISVVYRLSQAICTLPGGLIIMVQKKRPTYEEAHGEVEHDLQEPIDAS